MSTDADPTFHRILLASHGTPGARAAETLAVRRAAKGAALHHLYVIAEFWGGMLGDDWLNNAATRTEFTNYLERELHAEAVQTFERVAQLAATHGLVYTSLRHFGDITRHIIEQTRRLQPDIVVIGARRRRGIAGLYEHIDLPRLQRALAVPLMTAPFAACVAGRGNDN